MMKTNKITTFLIILSLLVLNTGLSFAQEASDSAELELDLIKENVKRRIEEVVREKESTNNIIVSYVGKLSSRTTNALSIETREGIKLASTSAQTAYIDGDEDDEIDLDDVGIGDYLSILGFLDSNQVLDARRIIIAQDRSEFSRESFYGSITSIDVDEEMVTMTNPANGETLTLEPGRGATINQLLGNGETEEIDLEEIASNSAALVIYIPAAATEDTATLTRLSIKSIGNSNRQAEATTSAVLGADTPVEDIIPADLR